MSSERYVIEKGIPIPTTNGTNKKGGARRKYPFDQMDVGDSIFFEDEDMNGSPYRCSVAYGHLSGKGFTGRNLGDGIRIWRTS